MVDQNQDGLSKRKTNKDVTKSKMCNHCDFVSFWHSNLEEHLKTHTGEKSNKCNQCDFASSKVGNLRIHLKTHSGVKQVQPV